MEQARELRRRSCAHLVRLILNRNGDVPNFSVLLGAGASVSSGVESGVSMVEQWRRDAYQGSASTDTFPTWLEGQRWYDTDDEYGTLFEMAYDQPAQRRVFVEEKIKKAHPNWGYVYLTSLLSRKVFDVVFTTNFDDLINEACYLYSEGLRPIVSAHDSAISSLRVTSGRPKIIKLHGDFLYDSIKNTVRELESLETNTKRKLTQFAQEYGLVVVGYGGHDRTVMDTLEMLLRHEEHFPHGIYWCLRKGSRIGPRLESLLRRDNVFLTEIDGFDEFLAELHRAGAFTLPAPISAPLKVARNRAQLFVDVNDDLKKHSVIASDIKAVLDQVSRADSVEHIPSSMLASIQEKQGNKERALEYWRAAVAEDPTDPDATMGLVNGLVATGKQEEAVEIIKGSDAIQDKTFVLLRAKAYEEAIAAANRELKLKLPGSLVFYPVINRAIAYERLGRTQRAEADIEYLEKANKPDSIHYSLPIAAGTAALRRNKTELIRLIKEAAATQKLSILNFQTYPVFDEFRNDPDVIEAFKPPTKTVSDSSTSTAPALEKSVPETPALPSEIAGSTVDGKDSSNGQNGSSRSGVLTDQERCEPA